MSNDQKAGTLNLRPVGNSVGTTFPKEVLAELGLKAGDSLYYRRTTNGYEITAYDPLFAAAMEAHRSAKRQYRNAFHELADR